MGQSPNVTSDRRRNGRTSPNIKASLRLKSGQETHTKRERERERESAKDEFELCDEGRSDFLLDVPFDLRYYAIFLLVPE